jgi:ankyrin repeat protein
VEGDEAWLLLRGELADVGISSELATQNRDLIISTLRRIAETQDLLPGAKESAVDIIPGASSPESESDHRLSLDDDMADEFTGLPFLPLPPIGISYSDKPRSYADQDRSFSDKQPLPLDEYPIPVAMEMEMQESIDPRLHQLQLQPDTTPIPISTEIKPDNSALEINPPIPTSTKPSPNTDSNTGSKPDPTLQVRRTKKATRLSRLRWQLTNPKEPFITSIQQGNLSTVQSHLLKGADPNIHNSTGQTALMVSVSYAHEHIAHTLLEYGADPNIRSTTGQTALSAACLRGLDRLVTMLLLSGAKVDAGQNIGKTALLEASAYGQDRIVRILLEAGADVDGIGIAGLTALGVAAKNGNLRVARALLEGGAKVDVGKYVPSPLFDAVRGGWGEVVRVLLQFGADPYFVGRGGVTVLDLARRIGKREVLQVFEDFGVDVGDNIPVQYF